MLAPTPGQAARAARSPPAIDAAFVARDILPAFDAIAGARRDWRVSGPRYVRHPSARHAAAYLFRATADQGASVCVKAFLSPDNSRLREAEREYAALELRAAGGERAGYRTPRPLAFLAGRNAIVMEWVEGWKLQPLLMACSALPSREASLLAAAGRWLRRLHDSTASAPAPLGARALAEEIAMLRARAAAAGFSGEAALDRAIALLDRRAAALDALPVAQAILHDDFAPKNLLLSRGELIGVDISTLNRGPVCRDVSEFMLYFDLFDPRGAIANNVALDRPRIAPFLDGYEPAWGGVAPDWVLLRCLFSALRTWIETIEWSLRGGEIWRRVLPRFSFRRFRAMAAACESALG